MSAELGQVLDHLHGSQHPSAGSVALLACHLTRNLLLPGRPDITVPVLFDVRSPDRATVADPGTAGKLSLTVIEHGPPGLHPDPRRMAFFYSPTTAFVENLMNAWQASALSRTAASVCWAVTLDVEADGPANTIVGGSLGGAFGVALDELHTRQRRRLDFAHVPGLRRVHLDFRSRITNPRSAVSATVVDADGNLGPVTGLDHKVAAARRAHVDLVVAHPRAAHTTHGDSDVAIATARTVREAVLQCRTATNPRFRRSVMALALTVLLIAASAIFVVNNNERQQRKVAAEQLLREVVSTRESNPRLALQLGAAAVTLNDSPATRASLTETLARSHFASSVTDSGGVQALAVDRPGRLLASATATSILSLWRLSGSAPPAHLGTVASSSPVRTIVFAPGGQTLITGDTSNCIALWDITSPESPRLLPWRDPSPLARCGSVEPPDIPLPKIQDLALSPNGQLLAVASSDGSLRLLDLSVPTRPRPLSTRAGIAKGAWSAAFDPRGEALVTGSGDGTVTAWSIADPAQPRVLGSVVHAHADLVRGIAFHPDGRSFVTGSLDDTVKVWDASELGRLHVRKTLRAHNGHIFKVAYATDGLTFASAGADRTAIIWNADATRSAVLRGQDGYLRALAVVPGGQQIITGSLDGTIVTWAVAAPNQVGRVAPVAHERGDIHSIAFSADTRAFAVGTSRGMVHIYDTAQPDRPPTALPRVPAPIYGVAFSADGKLAEASSDEQIRLWDVPGQGPTTPLWTLSYPHGAVRAVAFDPTSQRLASGSADGSVAIWQPGVDSTQPISAARASQDIVATVAFGDQGRLLASGGFDKTVAIWSTSRPGQLEPIGRIRDHDEAVFSLQYSDNGALLAVSSADGSTSLWSTAHDAAAPAKLAKIVAEGPTRRIRAEAFSPDGHLLVTGGDQGTVAVYSLADPTSPRLLASLPVVEPAPSADGEGVVALAYGGHTLAVGSGDGDIRLFDMTRWESIENRPREMACALTVDGLSESAWAMHVPDVPFQPTCEH